MRKQTKASKKYLGAALTRGASSFSGMYKILQLLARAEIGEEVSNVIASEAAVQLIALKSGKI